MDVKRNPIHRGLGPLFLATIVILSGAMMGMTQDPPESQSPPVEDKTKK